MTSEPMGPQSGRTDEISFWEILAILLRRRTTIVLTTLLTFAAALAIGFRRDPTYTTEASFRPQGSQASTSQLLSLASQFGVNVPGLGSNEQASPVFYSQLLLSREILFRLASESYVVEGVGEASLDELLEIRVDDPPLRLRRTIEALRNRVLTVEATPQTGIVVVRARTNWPDLSQEIARRLLDEVAKFNLDTRQSQAAAERAFIEERLDSARIALTDAESAMQGFLQANRQWQNSPDLTFQHDRLDRDIGLRQEVYTTLVQSFEQARIAEVRDTPVITVLQAPYEPARDSRRIALIGIGGLALGAMAGLVLAFVVEAMRRPAPGDPAREDFRATWSGFVRSIPLIGRRAS